VTIAGVASDPQRARVRLGTPARLVLAVVVATTACGKKGPPLPPFPRVPAAAANMQAGRLGDDVYVWFTVPSANVDGRVPADIASVEVFAVTADAAPSAELIEKLGMRVAQYPVQPDTPSLPAPAAGDPEPRPLPKSAGVARGAVAVVRERLTPELRVPVALTPSGALTAGVLVEEAVPAVGPLVAPVETTPSRRYYMAIAVSPGGRESAPSAVVSVPIADASDAPGAPDVAYDSAQVTLTWTPSPGARTPVVEPPEPGVLAARPIVPPPAPTGYHVYAVTPSQGADDPYAIVVPTALTPQPLAVTEFVEPKVTFGVERCFEVRAVDLVGGALTLSRPSPVGCVTPMDTFPPAAPRNLAAIASAGAINLIWDENTEPDLLGYHVLRGEAPGDKLQALTTAAVRTPTFADTTVRPGVRYVYVVVAVDNAEPQNVSGQSNRAEETAR
jgi:hypothetical protein